MKIAIIDYGMGNLRSVQKACQFIGFDAEVTDDRRAIEDATHIILPGVGAAGDAVMRLREKGLFDLVKAQAKKGKPFLGICLGMQLLFDRSFEFGEHECLGLVPGEVVPFRISERVPHIGWNDLDIKANRLIEGGGGKFVYFVHSYYADNVPEEYVIATSFYGHRFVAAVGRDNVFGTQFHPEKSGSVGLEILKNFGGIEQ